MFTYILYALASGLLLLSFIKDKSKTKLAVIKAWKSFENILPQFLCILLIIGILLAVLNEQTISRLIGKESGVTGMIIAATVGSIVLIPGFIAFPLAASLLSAGAGYGQITMLLTTMMMVGIVTIPTEIRYFGRKATIKRNLFALIFAVCISFAIGGIIG